MEADDAGVGPGAQKPVTIFAASAVKQKFYFKDNTNTVEDVMQ